MNTNQNRQSGFEIMIIVAVIATIVVLGLVGYAVWQANHTNKSSVSNSTNQSNTSSSSQNPPTTTTPQPVQQTDPNAGYVVVKEWGVRFKPVSGLNGLEYSLKNNGSNAVFTTQQLKQLAPTCDVSVSGYGLGGMYRTAASSSAPSSPIFLATINGYSYYYAGTQATCVNNPSDKSTEAIFESSDASLLTSLKSLEAAK